MKDSPGTKRQEDAANRVNKFEPGELVFRKKRKEGRAFRDITLAANKTFSLNNMVFIEPSEVLMYVDEIYAKATEGLSIGLPYCKVLSAHGVLYILASRLCSAEERQRDDDLG